MCFLVSHSLPIGADVCRSQTDKIFSQQSALGKAHEGAQLLREQLETRQAQQAVIEAEITRQVGGTTVVALHSMLCNGVM